MDATLSTTLQATSSVQWSEPGGYGVSISLRRMIERIFGWMKTTANFRRTRLRGLSKTKMLGTFIGAAYNILRLVRLTTAAA